MRLRTFLRYLRPKYFLTSRRGRCALCGRATLYFLTDAPESIRNHAACVRCGSSSRHRHLALCVRKEFSGRGILRLSDFRNHPEISVLNASATSPVARELGTATNILCTEYIDGVAPGAMKDGIRNEDLQNLSLPEKSLDLVLTEDVFEHIPMWQKAFREVHRVLKPGGFHIFTIPYYFDRKTRELFRWKDGMPVLDEPIEYHGDPQRGQIPAFLHYGTDLQDFLSEVGFETRIEIAHFADAEKQGTWDSYTFVSRKL